MVEYLITKGANINITTTGGETVFMKAASEGSLQVLDWLIKNTEFDIET